MNDDHFHKLLHLIYEAGIDKELWPTVLDEFIDWLGSPSGHLSMIRLDNPESSIVYESNIAPGFGDVYEDRIEDDPWFLGAMPLKTGDQFTDQELCPTKLYKNSDYYQEVALPHGIDKSVGGIVMRNQNHNVVITGNGPADFKGFSDDEKEKVSQILPHINRAYRFNLHMFESDTMIGSLKNGLDSLTSPIALLDKKGLICYMNASFEQIIRSQSAFSIVNRRLITHIHKEQRQLEKVILTALKSLGDPEMMVDLGLRVSTEGGRGCFNLVVSPVRNNDAIAKMNGHAQLIVKLSDFSKPPVPSVDLLCSLYGLSRNQARLTKCLMSDMSVNEAADVLGIKVATARSYLKEILARTETNSQNSLLLKLSRISI